MEEFEKKLKELKEMDVGEKMLGHEVRVLSSHFDDYKLRKAYSFAKEKHKGQLDDNGKDYFHSHCDKVRDIIYGIACSDYNLQCSALLHDTIEDTKTTYEELVKEFNTDIADLVMEVTHEGNKNTGYYFPRLKTQRGMMLKFADRLSNLSRMEAWDEKRQAHYLKRSKFWKTKEDD